MIFYSFLVSQGPFMLLGFAADVKHPEDAAGTSPQNHASSFLFA
jgi:hypothetical protein